MRRFTRTLMLGLVGGFAACGPTNPGEMPPLAPRPQPVQPLPSAPDPAPVPGAPDPLDPSRTGPMDAGVPVTEIDPPQFRSYGDPAPQQVPQDAVPPSDATVLPPTVPDALPGDASKRPE